MKYLLITPALVLTGCLTQYPNNIIDEVIPEDTTPIPANVADSNGKWDGSKGEFPPGRTINYNGHGLGYNGYHVDQFHRKYYNDNGISPH
jgi:hypothetical protein